MSPASRWGNPWRSMSELDRARVAKSYVELYRSRERTPRSVRMGEAFASANGWSVDHAIQIIGYLRGQDYIEPAGAGEMRPIISLKTSMILAAHNELAES